MVAALAAGAGPAAAAPPVNHAASSRSAATHAWGKVDRGLLAALVSAGGGAADFRTTVLIGVLAGPRANALVVEQIQRDGAVAVKRCINTLDYSIGDVLALLRRHAIPMTAPAPDPQDGRALLLALYGAGAGSAHRSFSLDAMLDRLLSPALRERLRSDIAARYGADANARCTVILERSISTLKAGSAA